MLAKNAKSSFQFLLYLLTLSSANAREVSSLIVDSRSLEWIALSWEPPCANATNVSVVYLIERYDGKNYSQSNETGTRHNATNLDPCTQYTFNVKVFTKVWVSNGINLTTATDYASKCTIDANFARFNRVSPDRPPSFQFPILET